MPDTKEEIEQRMEELAREYGRTPPEDQRRVEIFKEVKGLCERLNRLWISFFRKIPAGRLSASISDLESWTLYPRANIFRLSV
jgi:hypothetical protein